MNGVDRHFVLDDLVGPGLCSRLQSRIDALLGVPSALVDTTGHPLWGEGPHDLAPRAPVRLELEALGYLVAPGSPPQPLQAAAGLLGTLLQQRAQYLMAADLHVEAIQADYETLLAKNAELQASERRLRELSEQLERRVQEQVALIDARQRQLYEAERLASVGQLAAGVAHEIINPLGFVRSNLSASRRYVADMGQLYRAVQRGETEGLQALCERLELGFVFDDFDALLCDSVDGADRIARIVRDLKGFSNVDGGEREATDLNEKLTIVCDMVAAQLPDGVHLHRALAAQLPPVFCSAGYINQVFMNILRNAVQAVGANGVISVTSGAENGAVMVEVADDGQGIAPEHLNRVFDPFFTTREVGSGTGLGLTVARDIVKAHNGRIEIDSRPGSGCRVRAVLPTGEQ